MNSPCLGLFALPVLLTAVTAQRANGPDAKASDAPTSPEAVRPVALGPAGFCADWIKESNQAGSGFGGALSSAGDVNGDGFDEVILGAGGFDLLDMDEGRAWSFLGSPGGAALEPEWRAENFESYSLFGEWVAGGGDVNGDGFGDVLVGSPELSLSIPGGTQAGSIYAYLGSPQGLPSFYSRQLFGSSNFEQLGRGLTFAGDLNGDGFDDVLTLALSNLRAYYGSQTGLSGIGYTTLSGPGGLSTFGSAFDGVGDVNGDGFDDVVVGDYLYSNAQLNEGRALLYLGTAGGIATTPSWTFESGSTGAHAGYSVAGAGDTNGDGFDDVIVGAPRYSNEQSQEGRAYLFLGSPDGLQANAAWAYESGDAGALLGDLVEGAGDVNGDGFEDVLIGCPDCDDGQTDEGTALAFFGSATGLSASPDWIEGSNVANAWYPSDLAAAGDVNGDGYGDVLVGWEGYSSPEEDEGLASIYRGSANGLRSTVQAAVAWRNAGTNPDSFVAPPAILGTAWSPSVDLTTTGHTHASVRGSTAGGTFPPLPGGQVPLISGASVFTLPTRPGPSASWSIALPNDPSLCGLTVHTQAVHLFGIAPYALTNAQDLVVGHP